MTAEVHIVGGEEDRPKVRAGPKKQKKTQISSFFVATRRKRREGKRKMKLIFSSSGIFFLLVVFVLTSVLVPQYFFGQGCSTSPDLLLGSAVYGAKGRFFFKSRKKGKVV